MGLSHEHVGPKILAKIKIYILTRAELLFPVCYEIPCKKPKSLISGNLSKMAMFEQLNDQLLLNSK
jgi:hypothetical protein